MPEQKQSFCPTCGNRVSTDWGFCRDCGSGLTDSDMGPQAGDHSEAQPLTRSRLVPVALGSLVAASIVVGVVLAGLLGEANDDDLVDESNEAILSQTTLADQSNTPGNVSSTTQVTTTTSLAMDQPNEEVRLHPVAASASSTAPSSVDAAGNPVSYGASNLIDGDETTAWRTPGDGIGQALTVHMSGAPVVTWVGLVPGYAKVDPSDGTDRFRQNRIIESARWTFADGTQVVQRFEPVPELQIIEIPPVTTSTVSVVITATSDHDGRDFAAVSEIVLVGQSTQTTEPSGDSRYLHVFPLDPSTASSYSPGGHSYPATDIFAPTGTRFVAVTSGVVEEFSKSDRWDPDMDDGGTRGGLYVSLVGDDGFRYYGSHLSQVADGIEAGVRVSAGDLLGFVGRSGNARNTPSHLHFGISRPTHAGDWEVRRGEIDPIPLLDAWRSGEFFKNPGDDVDTFTVERNGVPDSADRASEPLGSGCTPGPGPLPDGIWFGWIEFSQTTTEEIAFDLACYHGGPLEGEWYSNNNPTLRYVPVEIQADVFSLQSDSISYDRWLTNPCPDLSLTQCHGAWLYMNDGLATQLYQIYTP